MTPPFFVSSYYHTNFDSPPAPENPITEADPATKIARWVRYDPDQTPVQTIAGYCYGTMTVHAQPPFDDSHAYMDGHGDDHGVEGTVWVDPVAANAAGCEVEVLLRMHETTVSASGVNNGYEVNASHKGYYVQIGRFKGPLLASAVSPPVFSTGDKFGAWITGDTIVVLYNGVPLLLDNGLSYFKDSDKSLNIKHGSPGIGFYIDPSGNFANNTFRYTDITIYGTGGATGPFARPGTGNWPGRYGKPEPRSSIFLPSRELILPAACSRNEGQLK